MPGLDRCQIDVPIHEHDTRTRTDFSDQDIAIYVRSLVGLLSRQRQFHVVRPESHLYRDLHWTLDRADRFRQELEAVFRVELPKWEFLCARTVHDITMQLTRSLDRERRCVGGRSPAA
jgi:hypothetical protein